MKWITLDWWKYLLERRTDYQISYEIPYREIIICRIKNHPEGTIYYNPGGYEPDNHCRTCGDEIG